MYAADDEPASPTTDTVSTRTTTNPVTESTTDTEISPPSTEANTADSIDNADSDTSTVLDTTASIGPTMTNLMEATAMPVKKDDEQPTTGTGKANFFITLLGLKAALCSIFTAILIKKNLHKLEISTLIQV